MVLVLILILGLLARVRKAEVASGDGVRSIVDVALGETLDRII